MYLARLISLAVYAVFAIVNGCFAGENAAVVVAARLAGAAGMTLLSESLISGRNRKTAYAAMLTVNLAFAALSLMETVSFYFSKQSFSFEFYFHLNPETLRHGSGGFELLIALAVFWFAASIGAVAWGWRSPDCAPPRRRALMAAAGLALLLVPGGTVFAMLSFSGRVLDARPGRQLNAAALAEYGIKIPDDGGNQAIKPGKNLVVVYLESVENSYLQSRIFPGLLPNISRMIREEAVVFADVSEARNSNFTVGGVYSSLTGSILTTAHLLRADDRRDGGSHGFDVTLGSRLETVPSILRRAGYSLDFMVGCDPAFAGLNVFLDMQRFDRLDHAKTLLPPNAPERPWGMRDRELLSFTLDRYRERAASGKPFALFALTIDPHNPDGFTEPDGPKYTGWGERRLNLLDALFATDRALGNFIAGLRKSPGWDNTVVLVVTDHLAKSNTLSPVIEKNKRRRLIAFALNAGPHRVITTPAKVYDLAPTILTLLGIDAKIDFPLGESLVGSTPPSPLRLQGDSEAAEKELIALLRTRSAAPVGLHPEIGVAVTPYPALLVAGRTIPLYVSKWGVQQLPVNSDAFAVRIDETGNLAGSRRLNTAAEAETFLARPGSYAVLASPAIASALSPDKTDPKRPDFFYLLRGKPGQWQSAAGTDPTLLKIME